MLTAGADPTDPGIFAPIVFAPGYPPAVALPPNMGSIGPVDGFNPPKLCAAGAEAIGADIGTVGVLTAASAPVLPA